ncbi:eEF1-gamma domain-containing protein [Microstroma glucosiphilum]|uniref:EEF1-gamma domain-containing protein n=1 Tax=Pseudomicrostroma glucosiphilum TaxID=1684307 RepID=A0A316TYJ2_9BASI|nr:eEF1-gamma domain-containing protein [Pseudomicrostroma glucosiphilum]PWN18336.1 eEF1-gamma domain-containing protein [Pseudomicrostroma glucosiphilum]
MSSVGTLYSWPNNPKAVRILAAAAYNGAKVDFQEVKLSEGEHQKPEFLKKFPHGKVPTFTSSEGLNLSEASAIARFVAGISNNANLLGSDNATSAQIEQWISFSDDELLTPAFQIASLCTGRIPYNKVTEDRQWTGLNRAFATLETHIKNHTFLVGHQVTLADLTLASDILFVQNTVAGADFRSKYPNAQRYFETVINQAPVKSVFPALNPVQDNIKFTPPKKEEKPKAAAAPAAAAAPKAAKKPAAKKDDDDEEDDKPAEPKSAPHPCSTLPPTSFNLDEAKRQYSNLDTPDFLKWFYEKYDAEGYNIVKLDYKYNDELTQVFMSSNLITGLNSRLEASRKYFLGAGAVFGANNDSVIALALILRGKNPMDVLGVAPDIDSYSVTPLDISKAEDKKFFEDVLSWEGEYQGKKLAEGKFFK